MGYMSSEFTRMSNRELLESLESFVLRHDYYVKDHSPILAKSWRININVLEGEILARISKEERRQNQKLHL